MKFSLEERFDAIPIEENIAISQYLCGKSKAFYHSPSHSSAVLSLIVAISQLHILS
jgi:hypothetical protein